MTVSFVCGGIMNELKPCAECSSKAIDLWKDYFDEAVIGWTVIAGRDCWYIGCMGCNKHYHGPFDTKEQATIAWNTAA